VSTCTLACRHTVCLHQCHGNGTLLPRQVCVQSSTVLARRYCTHGRQWQWPALTSGAMQLGWRAHLTAGLRMSASASLPRTKPAHHRRSGHAGGKAIGRAAGARAHPRICTAQRTALHPKAGGSSCMTSLTLHSSCTYVRVLDKFVRGLGDAKVRQHGLLQRQRK
jgi:hypothetical protein